jgi:predicted house-cleaning noncanonical NTP pyrophosphatase (MazG superfamily)
MILKRKSKDEKQEGRSKANNKARTNAKLVRDKIPDLMKKGGVKPIIKIADDEEFIFSLKHKILEEAQQLKAARTEGHELEEIIDIMEAVNTYIKHKKVSVKNADKMRKYKLRKHGGFDKRILLEGVEEK